MNLSSHWIQGQNMKNILYFYTLAKKKKLEQKYSNIISNIRKKQITINKSNKWHVRPIYGKLQNLTERKYL